MVLKFQIITQLDKFLKQILAHFYLLRLYIKFFSTLKQIQSKAVLSTENYVNKQY